VTGAVLGGVLLAAGVCLLWSGIFPAPQRLDAALARLGRPVPGAESVEAGDDLDARLGAFLVRRTPVSSLLDRLATDLRILRRTPEEQALAMAVHAFIGVLWAPVVAAGAMVLGYRVPLAVPVWLALSGALLVGLLPYRRTREEARSERAAFRHALSAYCDVAGMAMAAGREVYASLFEAASIGRDPAFLEIREALQQGHISGDKPWDSLRSLGEALGVSDLVELGATVALAGDEGAAVRDTIASRARSIRERLIAETEKRAAAATERMAVPGAMLMIGFLWFLAFPALFLILQQSN
jgi:Flp pilus assembly protein TadB